MNIVIDTHYGNWAHMAADNLQDLHQFASSIGLARAYFHRKPGNPHYDVPLRFRFMCVKYGAREITRKEMVKFLHTYHADYKPIRKRIKK